MELSSEQASSGIAMAVRDASGTLPQRRSARALRKAERRLVAGIAEARDDPISDDEWLHCLELTLSEDRDDTLVMLPGYGLGAGAFTMVLRDLQAQGAGATFGRAVALDWPGTGLARFDRRNLSLKELVDYAVERLEAWRARRGFERVTLLGHSLGGYLAFCYCGATARVSRGTSCSRRRWACRPTRPGASRPCPRPPGSRGSSATSRRAARDAFDGREVRSCGAAACGAAANTVGMAKFKRNGQWAGGLKPRFADYVDAFATHCAYESFGEYFYEKCVIGYPRHAFLRARDAANDGFRCSFFFGCEDWIDCRVVVDAARGAACVNGPTGGAMHRIERCAHQSMVDHPAAFARAVLLLSRGAA
ncbi:1-acylglycerol-3-phosphate O-acyltransferase [Aureococcus anophagefferens]|nr:1-acylglycerol-3-phosphate O-acyltransferase [Aureococcus anophagefferens]